MSARYDEEQSAPSSSHQNRAPDIDDPLLNVFGTEFDTLDDEEKNSVSKKPQPIQEQVALDEQGRRRFHGAFQGGFSAGYYMTVGTKEGWEPKDFKSSRTQRSANASQRPEDYMDTEDLGEYGIAPRQVQTTAAFDGGATTQKAQKHRLAWEHEGSVSSVLGAETEKLMDVVKPVSDTSAVRVLRKMGWRQGRGVGSLTLAERTKRLKDLDVPSSSADAAAKFEFAPDDFDLLEFEEKHDNRGLGYHGLAQTHVLNEQFGRKSTAVTATQKTKKGIRGQAFGVGAFEDDDDDIYTSEDTSKYDFVMGGHDPNKNALDGGSDSVQFVIAAKPLMPKKLFEPPKLPRDYDPKVGIHGLSKAGTSGRAKDSDRGRDRDRNVRVGIEDRRRLLHGENVDKEGAQSVLKYLKETDRKRIEAIRAQTKQREDRHQSTSTSDSSHSRLKHDHDRRDGDHRKDESTRKSSSHVQGRVKSELMDQKIDMHVFDRYPEKQKRFVDYVSYLSRGLTCPQPVSMTDWEWDKEKAEFEQHLPDHMKEKLLQAKGLRSDQKPLAGDSIARNFVHLLGRKFTSANREDQDDANNDEAAPDDDRTHAVKMEMFGSLTRTKLEWHPDKLMCKRFNVPEPYVGSTIVGCPSLQAARDIKDRERTEDSSLFMGVGLPSTEQDMKNRQTLRETSDRRTSDGVKHEFVKKESSESFKKLDDFPAAIFSPATAKTATGTTPAADLDVQLSAVDLAEKPPMDLFRTIFGDDDKNKMAADDSESELSDENNSAERLRQAALSSRKTKGKPVEAITGAAQPSNYKPMTLQPINDDHDEHVQPVYGGKAAVMKLDDQDSSFGPELPPDVCTEPGLSAPFVKQELISFDADKDEGDDGIEIIKEKAVKGRSHLKKDSQDGHRASRDSNHNRKDKNSTPKYKSEKKKKHKSKDKHSEKKSKKKSRSKSVNQSSDTEELSSD